MEDNNYLRKLFRPLRAVFGTLLFAAINARRIEHTADNVITDTRKVLYATTADHYYRVFLQRVTFARDVRGNFHAVRKTHPGNFTQSRVRLLWRRRKNLNAYSSLKRR